MKTRTLTRYRLRWTGSLPGEVWDLLFGAVTVGSVSRSDVIRGHGQHETTYTAILWPSNAKTEVAYEGPSLPQAKRETSKAIRLFMCREVDSATVVGTRVKRGRVRR